MWFHLDRKILKEHFILKTKIRLDNKQLDNQHDPPLQTNPPIPSIIGTDNFKINIEILPPPNIPSVISLDLNTSKGADGELATYYFQMILNNYQVKDNCKAIIDKGKSFRRILRAL